MRNLLLRLVIIVPVVLLIGLFGYILAQREMPKSIEVALARGERPVAPMFTLTRYDGGKLVLTDLRGKVVVLNFWASWCGPCRDEAPLLEKVWREYRDRGVMVVGVNIQDLESAARKFIQEFRITYPNVRDGDGHIAKKYGVTGVPETFFIDRSGRIVQKFPGAVVEFRLWQQAVERALEAGGGI
ncbi:MAG: TlpA disulfide reductase family protein [Armatimonadota bacterium]|nr:TlpA disulfide reductase family protein [Armatimonadota bacterium]